MMHRFPLPDDSHLEKLIEQVFEINHRPEQEKINRLEAQLLHKIKRQKPEKKLNKIPWWIVLLLAGGFATAAWWAGEKFIVSRDVNNKDQSSVKPETIIENNVELYEEEAVINKNDDSDKMVKDEQSPVIYLRESF